MRILIKKSTPQPQESELLQMMQKYRLRARITPSAFEGRLEGNHPVLKELYQSNILFPIRIQVS